MFCRPVVVRNGKQRHCANGGTRRWDDDAKRRFQKCGEVVRWASGHNLRGGVVEGGGSA